MNHEKVGKTHLLGLKADVRADAALLLPWPACRPGRVDREATAQRRDPSRRGGSNRAMADRAWHIESTYTLEVTVLA